MNEHQRFQIVLEAAADDRWAAKRLARWLKCALRHYGFRCTDCRELPSGGRKAPDEASNNPSASSSP